MQVRIIKVGGSLLDWPPLPRAIASWLATQPAAFNVLICGGGPFAETIRRADRDFRLGDDIAHWLCVEALGVTAGLLAATMPHSPLVGTYTELKSLATTDRPASLVFDPREFLTDHEATLPPAALPHSWSVTSDSIAARIAEVLAADELVLLKSAASPAMAMPSDMAAAGFVDSYFPTLAARIGRVRAVNLRRLP